MTKKKKRKQAPAKLPEATSGAQDNVVAQQSVAAAIIFERLKRDDLVWLHIDTPRIRSVESTRSAPAPGVLSRSSPSLTPSSPPLPSGLNDSLADLIQVGGRNGIDAYRIKWSEWADQLTLLDLVGIESGEPSVIMQLASAWNRLNEEHSSLVYIHLVSNDHPSPKKFERSSPGDHHLAKFLATEWKNGPSKSVTWGKVWSELQNASGLSEKEFMDFVAHCRFDCSYVIPAYDEEAGDDQPFNWIELIHKRLFEEGTLSETIDLSHREICSLLDWQSQNEWRAENAGHVARRDHLSDAFAPNSFEPRIADGGKPRVAKNGMTSFALDLHDDDEETVSGGGAMRTSDEDHSSTTKHAGFSLIGRTAYKEKKSWKDLASEEPRGQWSKRTEGGATPDLMEQRRSGSLRLRQLISSRFDMETITTSEGEVGEEDLLDGEQDETANGVAPSTKDSAAEAPDDSSIATNVQDDKEPDNFSRVAELARRQERKDSKSNADTLETFTKQFDAGNELFAQGKLEEAEKEYVGALEVMPLLADPDPEKAFSLLINLAEIYTSLNQLDKTVELYEQANNVGLAGKVSVLKYVTALLKLGDMDEQAGKYIDAEVHYRKASEAAASSYGLERNDSLIDDANEACLRISRTRRTAASRFDASELDRFRDQITQETSKPIMHRKSAEIETKPADIWLTDVAEKTQEQPIAARPSHKRQWIVSSVIFLIVFAFGYALLIPNSGKYGADYSGGQTIKKYESADGRKTIELKKDGRSRFSFDGKIQFANFHFVGHDLMEVLPLIPGHLRNQFVFFTRADKAVVDADGASLYPDDSPELVLVKNMWRYAKLAEEYTNSGESISYPASSENFKSAKDGGTYENPYTGETECATVFSANGHSRELTVRSGIQDGELWKGQPTPHLGAIVCNNYNERLFFIRACDRQGKWLTSAEPNKCFFIELRRGVNTTEDTLKKIERDSTPTVDPNRDISFIFQEGNDIESRMLAIRTLVPATLLLLLVFSFGMWKHRSNRKRVNILDAILCVLSSLLFVGWYVVALLDIR